VYEKKKIFTSGEVSEILGIRFYTMNYWEIVGKLPKAKRTETGQKYYTEEDIEMLKKKVKEIKRGK